MIWRFTRHGHLIDWRARRMLSLIGESAAAYDIVNRQGMRPAPYAPSEWTLVAQGQPPVARNTAMRTAYRCIVSSQIFDAGFDRRCVRASVFGANDGDGFCRKIGCWRAFRRRTADVCGRNWSPVTLKFRQVLYEPGLTIRHVYFPIDCLISLLTAVDKRRTLEVAGMVGNEGMAGMPFILGVGKSGVRALVQGAGTALRMPSGPFLAEFNRNASLQQALYRYTFALMTQISQTAACNRFHEADARLARWLLMTRDRVGSDEFFLTHEFLAHMLGLRREGVTQAASALKRRGVIRYSRGKIKILNGWGERFTAWCTCYRAVQSIFERVQSSPRPHWAGMAGHPSDERLAQGAEPRQAIR